jgi:hypothetical protein
VANKKFVVQLSSEERKRLWQLISKGKSAAKIVLKARILLKADQSEAGVRHKIRLDEPGRRIIPVIEGSYRNATPDCGRRRRVPTLSSSRLRPDITQNPVDRRGAHRQ